MFFGQMVFDSERSSPPIVDEISDLTVGQCSFEPVGKAVHPVRRRVVGTVTAKLRQIVGKTSASDYRNAFPPECPQPAADTQ